MSDNNELSLLGEDLGDDDYDLGNEDEDALLADDYDLQGEDYLPDGQNAVENQIEFGEYEEPLEDDVLDLGVTDALDDLDSEIQESADDTLLPKKQTPILEQSSVVKKEAFEFSTDVKPASNVQGNEGETSVDSNAQLESEEEEEGGEGEGRGRFKSERTNIVSLKSGKTYGNIPDSLDHVLPADDNNSQKQSHKREGNQWRNRRGRGNGPRGGSRQHYHSKAPAALPFQGPVFSPGAGPGSLGGHSNPPGSPFARHSHTHPHPHSHLHSHPHPHPHAPPPSHAHPHPQTLRHPPPLHRPHSQPPPPPPQRQHPPPPPPPSQQPPIPPAHPSHLPLGQAQQSLQPLQQSMQQPMQQPPHKILINPHFRGAVQPHPEARLIWDSEPPSQPTGDGLLPFPPRVFVESPYPPSSQGNYEQHSFQHHEPLVFHNSIQHPNQHQQLSHAPPPNQSYYPGEMYVDHPPSQPPLSQPIHNQPPHQNSSNVEYWHDMQSPHPPNQIQGLPPHNRENFYPPPDVFNNPQFPGSGHVPQDQQFAVHLDQVTGPPEPAVWQGAGSDTMQIPASQVTGQQFPSTQGIFRLTNPGVGHGPGPGPGPGTSSRFRTPGRNFRNFPPQRPRFTSPINGPHQRRHGGQIQHDLNQPSQQSSPDLQVSQSQSSQCQNFRSPQKRPSFEGSNTNVVPLTQGRFDSAPKRKKRMPDMSNLHEVQTVDTLPSQIKAEGQDENEDEETREYRKKIEEQKRLRERILQQKEARRKLAALEKQRELQKKDIDMQAGGDATSFFGVTTDPPQGNAIATIVNRNTVEPHTAAVRPPSQLGNRCGSQDGALAGVGGKQRGVRGTGRGRGRGGRGQAVGGVQTRRQSPPASQPPPPPPQEQQQQQQQQQSQHIALQQQQVQHVQVVPLQGGPAGQRIVRSTLKPAALSKSGQVGPSTVTPKRVVLNQGSQRVVQVTAPRTVTLRGANNTKLPANQMTQPKAQVQQPQPPQQTQQQLPRRVVQTQQSRPLNSVPGRTVISNQNTSITVTAQAPEVASMPRTKLVAVENLAASTTDSQLRRMCQRVGIVENIQMIPAQRRAVITFSNPASAVTFFKRYQRKMVDLSLISVKLLTV